MESKKFSKENVVLALALMLALAVSAYAFDKMADAAGEDTIELNESGVREVSSKIYVDGESCGGSCGTPTCGVQTGGSCGCGG